jgi:hypothetical protein
MNHYRRSAWKIPPKLLKKLVIFIVTSVTGLMREPGTSLPPPGFRRPGARFQSLRLM